MAETMLAELVVAPHWGQGRDEDSNLYDFQKGWLIEAAVRCSAGFAIYTLQGKSFGIDDHENAHLAMCELCGHPRNGFTAEIEADSIDWMLTGATY